MRRPFMDDPAQLTSLEGQQYLVLRPTIAVASLYREVQDAALARLGGDTPHPRTEHVTLRGDLSLPPTETIAEAELVWYEDGAEHAEVICLGT